MLQICIDLPGSMKHSTKGKVYAVDFVFLKNFGVFRISKYKEVSNYIQSLWYGREYKLSISLHELCDLGHSIYSLSVSVYLSVKIKNLYRSHTNIL